MTPRIALLGGLPTLDLNKLVNILVNIFNASQKLVHFAIESSLDFGYLFADGTVLMNIVTRHRMSDRI